MADNYIKSELYKAHYLTVFVETNTGTVETLRGTESTSTVTANDNDLMDLGTITVLSGGNSVTDSSMLNLAVSAYSINSAPYVFSGFEKFIVSDTITFTDGVTTVSISDTLDLKYLNAGAITAYPDIKKADLVSTVNMLFDALRKGVDAIQDADIYDDLTAIGMLRD